LCLRIHAEAPLSSDRTWCQCLEPKQDEPPSSSAFNVNLRRYNEVQPAIPVTGMMKFSVAGGASLEPAPKLSEAGGVESNDSNV